MGFDVLTGGLSKGGGGGYSGTKKSVSKQAF